MNKLRPFRSDSDWKCPEHNVHVSKRIRMPIDEETGKRKYAGEYFACPHYPKSCEYYVSPGDGTRSPMVVDMENV